MHFLFNPRRPPYIERPRFDKETGLFLNYRDYPIHGAQRYKFFDPYSVIIQMRLYRYSRSMDFHNCWSADDFHKCFLSDLDRDPKKKMGNILNNVLRYSPFNLKSVQGVVKRTYTIRFREEMQYGLEWMMSAWIRRSLGMNMATQEQISEELDDIANMSDEEMFEYVALYEGLEIKEPDWRKILDTLPIEREVREPKDMRALLKVISRAEDNMFIASFDF